MAETRLLSPATKVNIALLCIGFLVFVAIRATEYLTLTVGLIAAAIILAYLLWGPVKNVELLFTRMGLKRPGLRRTLSIITVYLLMFALVILAMVRLIPPLANEVKDFAQELPTYLGKLEQPVQPAGPLIQKSVQERQKQQVGNTVTAVNKVTISRPTSPTSMPIVSATTNLALQKTTEIYKQYASRLGAFILDIGTSTLASVVFALTTLILVFYFLQDGRGLKEGFVYLMPQESEAGVSDFLARLHVQFYNFIKGQAVISVLSGSLMYILLMLLDLKYSLLLGVFFGLASIVPVIGPWLGLIPIILLLAFGTHPTYIIQVLLYGGIFYLIKTYWFWPLLVNRRYDIHPIIFILTFVACLKIVGFLGILISFPLASIIGVWLEGLKRPVSPE